MRIELTTEGGFVSAPGLAKPIVLESADLPAGESLACEALAREVAACGRPESTPAVSQRQVPDGRTYRMKIDIDGQSYSLEASDTAMPPAYRQLLKLVRAHGSRANAPG